MATASRGSNNITGDEFTPCEVKEILVRTLHPGAKTLIRYTSMPEVVRPCPVHEDKKNHQEHCHEKIVLLNHDALLLLFPLPNNKMTLGLAARSDRRNTGA